MSRWYSPSPSDPAPAVSLRALWPDAHFIGCHDLLATGYATDARRLQPGEVFLALRGPGLDGPAQVADALARGAVGVVVDERIPDLAGPQVWVPDLHHAAASLAHLLAGYPARRVETIAVTGAAGKTATLHFLRAVLDGAGSPPGLVGPEDWSDGRRSRPRAPLPLHAPALAEMLHAIVEAGCRHAVVEVSLEALENPVFTGAEPAAVLVGTLEDSDGLDVPGPATRLAARLVRAVQPEGLIVLDGDEPAHRWLEACRLDATVLTYGLGASADVRAQLHETGPWGCRGLFRTPVGDLPFRLALAGRAAVRAAAAATAYALVAGLPPEAISRGLEGVSSLPGRLECPGLPAPFLIRVDRARTGPELRRAIGTLRELSTGRLHCILSARADADSATRSGIARVLETHADLVTLTPDCGAHDVDADAILDDHLALFRRPGRVRRDFDRRAALATAMTEARPGDAILLAGRGPQRSPFGLPASTLPPDLELVRRVWADRATRPHRRSA